MIKSVIIDDEAAGIETLSLLLKKHKTKIQITGKANSINKGIEIIQEIRPQLVFLALKIPGDQCFELLNAFENPNFKVIFCTDHGEYAIKAIKYSALDFLLKPLKQEDVDLAIAKAEKEINQKDLRLKELKEIYRTSKPRFLIIPENNGYTRIVLDDIIFISAKQGGYSIFHFENKKNMVAVKPLNYYEKLLPNESFYRAHRSHLINLEKVVSWTFGNENRIVMSNECALDVSVRRKSKLKKILMGDAQ